MRAWVVYESMFGNSEAIAREVAAGLARTMRDQTFEVGSAPRVLEPGVRLLVVGAPTHRFGLSRPDTRRAAEGETDGPLASSVAYGVREWLNDLQGASDGTPAAAFGTCVQEPRWVRHMGRAARSVQRRLRALGFTVVRPPETFYVAGITGPLAHGERERARAWGEALAAAVAPVRNAAAD